MARKVAGIWSLAPLYSVTTLLMVTLLLFGIGCSDKRGRSESPNYPVLDSGYVLADHREPYWLDNGRIIFIGLRPGQPPPKPMEALVDAYIWDTRTNQVKLDMKDAAGVCFFRDEIRYTVRPPDGSVKLLRGRLGDLHAIDVEEAKKTAQLLAGDVLREIHSLCDSTGFGIQFPGRPDPKDGHIKAALLEGHGYLDLGPRGIGTDHSIRYYAKGQSIGIDLPIKRWELGAGLPHYVPFMNKYLVYSWQNSATSPITEWPRGMPRSIYLLSPGGKVDVIQLPVGEYMRATEFYVTKSGVVAVTLDMSAMNDVRGGSIAYLIEGTKVTSVWSRVLRSTTVSPDGCKMAAEVSTKGAPDKSPTLRMINLCISGAQQ